MSDFIASQNTSSIQINPFSSVFDQIVLNYNVVIADNTASLSSLGSNITQPIAPFTGTNSNLYDIVGATLGGNVGWATAAGRPSCWW